MAGSYYNEAFAQVKTKTPAYSQSFTNHVYHQYTLVTQYI